MSSRSVVLAGRQQCTSGTHRGRAEVFAEWSDSAAPGVTLQAPTLIVSVYLAEGEGWGAARGTYALDGEGKNQSVINLEEKDTYHQ
jgi:hypothetical protein